MLRNYRRLLLVIIAVQPESRKGRNRKKYGVFRERSKGERFSMIIERRENVRGTMNGIHLQILEFGHASGEQDWEGNSISPSYTRLYYICAGDGFLTVNGETMPLEQGNCYLLPAGFSFSYGCHTSMEQIFFHVRLPDETGVDLLRAVPGPLTDTPGMEHIRSMIPLLLSENLCDALQLRQELYASILSMLRGAGITLSRPCHSRCVLDAAAYIRENLSIQLTVGELAAHAHVSESTLEKSFRAELGMTIGRYIDEEIFLRAESLLRHTDLPVSRMSEQFGFCDQFYFSRRFRAHCGLSPQQYRKRRPI